MLLGRYFLFLLIISCVNSKKCKKKLPERFSPHLDKLWCSFKARFNKSYSIKEEPLRRKAWEENLVTIYEHNQMAEAGHHTFTLNDNHLSDLSTKEYNKRMMKLKLGCKKKLIDDEIVGSVLYDPTTIPPEFDWRTKGLNFPPINQRSCGSCYALSIATSIQGQVFKKTGLSIPLSAQQIVDCSRANGNLGCDGGSLRNTLRYLEKNHGIMAESNYPYVSQYGTCKYQKSLMAVNISSWAVLPKTERALEAAIVTVGPIPISINAGLKTFQLYHGGIYDDPLCTPEPLNHAMLVVGYTPKEWIIMNWWGDKWGEDGFMKLAKNKNLCGLTNNMVYAVV